MQTVADMRGVGVKNRRKNCGRPLWTAPYMVLSTLLLENSPKNVQKYEPVLRFLDHWKPRTDILFRCLILHVAINFTAIKFTKFMANVIFL